MALYQSSLASLQNGNQKNETLLFYFGHHDHLDIIAKAGFTNEGIKSINFQNNLWRESLGTKYLFIFQ